MSFRAKVGSGIVSTSIVCLAVACGGTGEASRSESLPAGAEEGDGRADADETLPLTRTDTAGGQTTDFGDGQRAACRLVRTEVVDVEAARAEGFPIDQDLALFVGDFEVPFHRDTKGCGGTPDVSGRLLIRAALARVSVERYEREPAAPDFVTCPDRLTYVADVELASSEGSLSGSFQADVYPSPGSVYWLGVAEASQFAGSLRIRVNPTRPHTSGLSVRFQHEEAGVSGDLSPFVRYTDGLEPMGDEGDIMFWPAERGSPPCEEIDELLAQGSPGSELFSLDAYGTR